MMKAFYSFVWIFFGSVFLIGAAETNAPFKLRLESPLDYQIFQRATREQGEMIIAGTVLPETKEALPLDALEARLTGKSFTGDGLPDKWQWLPFDPRVGAFRGALAAPAGGWYRLEVRALQQK